MTYKNQWRGWNFAGIYSLWHVESGKVYVGQAQDIARRIGDHRRCSIGQMRSRHLYHAVEKYGWDAFEWVVMERVDDLALLNEREQYWIDTFHACNPQQGYNLCPIAASSRGVKRSDETRAKISAAQKGRKENYTPSVETRARLSTMNIGRKHTPEAIANMRAAQKGLKKSAEAIAKNSAWHKGRKPSAEACAKNSAAHKGRKGTVPSAETRAKLSEAHKGHKPSIETRAKMSEAQKARYLREKMQGVAT